VLSVYGGSQEFTNHAEDVTAAAGRLYIFFVFRSIHNEKQQQPYIKSNKKRTNRWGTSRWLQEGVESRTCQASGLEGAGKMLGVS